MCASIAVVYNQPTPSRYHAAGEQAAVDGVLEEVRAVNTALSELGFGVVEVPLALPVDHARDRLYSIDADIIFNLFEGFSGYPESEADISDLFFKLDKPCTGSPGKALRLALDKATTSTLLKSNGILTPKFQLFDNDEVENFCLDYPCIVKPALEDASHGLSERNVVGDPASLKKLLEDLLKVYPGKMLVEEFIDGREFNATVIGDKNCCLALPISEIKYSLPPGYPGILTFAAKWQPDSLYYKNTQVVCPAAISKRQRHNIERTAQSAFRLVGCSGYARIDFRLGKAGSLYVIDVNPNPDISPGSGAACQAEAAGMIYRQFIGKIIDLAMERRQTNN